ncbi:MAG: NnrS family protein [Deltaproteobacteria bacterium]|nr:NnrS family protein [Deltaproteobacteria bacterium]
MSALFSVGFRSLFLCSAFSAAFASSLWGLQLSGVQVGISLTPGWHAHEMVFGFVGAMVAGFLLTAVPSWTKSTPLSGWPLMLLCSLWGLGRLLPFTSTGPVQSLLSLASAFFLPGLLIAVGVPIVKKANRRNYGVLLIVWILAMLSVGSLAALLGWWAQPPSRMSHAAVLILVVLVALIGGRITPFFTGNYFKKQGRDLALRSTSLRDHLAMGSLILTLLLWNLDAPSSITAASAFLSAILHASRMQNWGTLPAFKVPFLAVLHIGYFWIIVSLLLVMAHALWPEHVAKTTALHGFTLGVIGSYGIGMMSRVSLGHTGRIIEANPPAIAAFALMGISGIFRVFAPFSTHTATHALSIAAYSFSAAYLIFILVFAKVLILPRPDGR